MQSIFATILIGMLLVSCASKQKQQEPTVIYDPAVIREFVFATASADTARSLAMTDSLLVKAIVDSATYNPCNQLSGEIFWRS